MRAGRTLIPVLLIGLFAGKFLSPDAWAGARPDQVHRLQEDLTPVGAERRGNADGTIPEWTGGITEPPVPYQPGDHHPDPFAGEEKLFRIDASNKDDYRDRLSAGQLAMLARFPDFYLEVYPTHRTAAFPQRIYDKTAENARKGALIDDGNAVVDVAEGFPFPFPENAKELIWNHRLRYKGTGSIRHINMVAPTTGGAFTEVLMTVTTTNPYYIPGETLESIDNHLLMFQREITSPPRLAGNVLLVYESLNQAEQPRKAWVYNPGQRRVIRAPNVAYDSPSGATDGLHVSDMTDMFNGALDRFDWELKGKREMYVPYNSYRVHSNEFDYDDLVRPGHLDPSYMRYELHRVWVVEARLRDGNRHINSRRTYYLDEDSYQILLADHYDANGQLWRYSEAHPINFYDVPVFWTTLEVHYDLDAARYAAFRLNPSRPVPPFNMDMNMNDFTPQALRRKGHR
ncbi:MAG: DUF1329 domain-containing protein [Xanthomonadales bacterium]|nr:DUF1329 domain-containing protein [Xanthomonadales bacterium]